jgi:hypothetical protein
VKAPRPPLASEEAERAILGAILLDNAAHAEAVELGLTADAFSLDSHRRIFLRMTVMLKSGQAVDLVTLREELDRRGETKKIGGVAYLASLTEGLPRNLRVDEYAQIVQRYRRTRSTLSLAESIVARLDGGGAINPDEVVSFAAQRFSELAQSNGTSRTGNLKPIGLGELLSRPAVPVDYVVDRRLVAGGVSITVAKPKVGKSTLARNLALCVARGEPFLGWPVKHGPVLYLALEERSEDVAADFRAMGADGSEDILLADAGTALDVVTILRERKPVLLVVDPLFRLLSVKDEKAYAEMYSALGPLIDVARETGTHICCLHHSSKLAKSEAIDAPLGSTALGGAVSTLLVMRRTETYRTLQTVQRIGEDLPETVLQFDPASKRLALGGSRELEEVRSVGEEILAALGSGSMTAQELSDSVEARTTFQRRALREMTESGQIQREGTGKRGDPYRYTKGCSAFPALAKNNGNKKLSDSTLGVQNNDQKKVVPAPITTYGKGGTTNQNDTDTPINIEEKVVPGTTGIRPPSEKDGNRLFAEREKTDWLAQAKARVAEKLRGEVRV